MGVYVSAFWSHRPAYDTLLTLNVCIIKIELKDPWLVN